MAREMFDPVTKEWVAPDEYYYRQSERSIKAARSDLPFPRISRDIEPYQSMITGEMITSRSHHREHLRQHNCVEVGNEKPKPRQAPKPSEAEMRKDREIIKAVAREKGVDVV